MIRFDSDYIEGCIPEILEALTKTNDEQCIGYGKDPHCMHAIKLIQNAINRPDADVHFMVGGTQTNIAVITSILKHHQGAICAESGHINVHETGALESVGHKCLIIPTNDGKITATQVDTLIKAHYEDESAEHIVQPGIVYISFPTESGTLYTKQELTDLYAVCQKHEIPLFIDGARLGYGLTASCNDVTIQDIANLCDVFYIGGTKVGALFGECIVILNPAYKKDFRYSIKQHGGMLAKGRLLGIQFEELFKDNRYLTIAKHAIDMAELLAKGFQDKGYSFYFPAQTNQLFPILDNEKLKELSQEFCFSKWATIDETHTAVRFVTSFATKQENVEKLIKKI
ncbi:MAG: aminotransferase class I/II-fold pyridoxal phosphate-dependent enzyme [Erysipelotrichaceae bacterium]|nr:aminotransferase class I/II-fold pyridoxal phosphate-dependent enzyme [Erysipelotrichaceae bacterium]